MINRRKALAVLGTAGIGTAVFQRALAAQARNNPVTTQMVEQAEWIAGITLTDRQREAAVKGLNEHQPGLTKFRAVKLDHSVQPAYRFLPYASPQAQPDLRGYDRTKIIDAPAANVNRPQSDSELAFASVRTLGALLRERKVSSVELTKLYLDRLRRYDPLLKCVVTFTEQVALRLAEKADRELHEKKDRGPLHGIPYGIKDLFAYPGYPTTWGAMEHRSRVLNEKAAVIERLEQAGSVLIAKLATNPYAGGSEIWFRGMTRNPWNPREGAAGSSSGPAAATAAGLVGFSIATHTAGSIHHPSTRCGVTGFCPTYGRVSRYGCMQLSWSLDRVGSICRTADDCAVVFKAIQGIDTRDSSTVARDYIWPGSRKLSTIRVGYDEKLDERPDNPELEILRGLGVTLVPIPTPDPLAEFGLTYEMIFLAMFVEPSAVFEDLTKAGGPKGTLGWPRFWLMGHLLSAADYAKFIRVRSILMERVDQIMQKVDVYLGDGLAAYSNLAGLPFAVVPHNIQLKEGNLTPQTQTFTGRVYDESTLLTLASAFQRACKITERPPLDKFLAEKDAILQGEKFPDENEYYID